MFHLQLFYKFLIRLSKMFYFYPAKVWYISNTSVCGRLHKRFLNLPAYSCSYTERRILSEV